MASSQDSSEYYFDDYDDSQFLHAIHEAVLPGDVGYHSTNTSNSNSNSNNNSNQQAQVQVQAHVQDNSRQTAQDDNDVIIVDSQETQESEESLEPPPPAQPRRSPSPSYASTTHTTGTATSKTSLKRKRSLQTQDEEDDTSFGSLGLGGSLGSGSGTSGSGSAGAGGSAAAEGAGGGGGGAGIVGGGEMDEAVYGASRFGHFGEYMRRKRAKLQIQNADIVGSQQDSAGGDSGSTIFKGLSIYINGWTQPSVQDLRKLIVEHGGVFQPYLDKKGLVTHIITCSLTPAKIREFKNMKVARPEWLLESIKAGTLLPWREFQYIPEEREEGSQGSKPRQHQASLATTTHPRLQSQVNAGKTAVVASAGASRLPPPPRLPAPPAKPAVAAPKPASDPRPPCPPSVPPTIPAAPHAAPGPVAFDPLFKTDPKTTLEAAAIPGYASAISNPNAQRAMQNPEWRKAHTSVSADFIEGYYKNSRLHHLATWKAELRELVQEAQERAEAGGRSAGGSGGSGADGGGDGHVGKVTGEIAGVSMRGAELVGPKSPANNKWKGKGKAVDDHDRVIMHCDFDCFFVSAGLVSRPELKGKPVVVCHSQGGTGGMSSTSEIASCSYEARRFGLRNGMSLQQGRKLCAELITIPYEFDKYKEFSLKFYTVLMSHADDLQAVSVDEALIDVTDTVSQLRQRAAIEGSQYDPAKDFAETIRAEVRKATSCEISIGISHNILLARLATRKAKPGGSFHLLPEDVPEFLAPLDISDLHGFGRQAKQKALEKLGTIKLGELVKKSKAQLIEALGKATGETLYNGLRGVDDKQLESDKPRKSVSCEINYGIRFENNDQAEQFIYQMAVEVKKRLDAIDMVGRSITMKIMKRDPAAPAEPAKFLGHGPCDLFSKQGPLIGPGGKATSDDQVIGEFAWRLLKSFDFDPKDLRGIGLQVQKLESATAASSAPTGQALLPFKRVQDKSRTSGSSSVITTSKAAIPEHVQPPVEESTSVSISVSKQEDSFDLPSFSQIDMTVFESLPHDLKEELKKEYSRRSGSPFTSAGAGPVPKAGPSMVARTSSAGSGSPPKAVPSFNNQSAAINAFSPTKRRSAPMFPTKKESNYKRITQQLAPKSGAAISPQKSMLYALLGKKPAKKTNRVSEAKLRELGIDPEVFAALPKQVQDEQLVRARILKEKGTLPEPPSQRVILKAKKPTLPPGFVVYRAPPPRAVYRERPVLRQQGKSKREKLAFTEADEVQNVLEKWVAAYKHWAPREKDVEYLSKFLLQSVDGEKSSDGGMVNAISVMKWWLVLLRRFWPGSEYVADEDEPELTQLDSVGQAWWDAFRKVKREMDVVARKKFGGSLSLK